MSDNRPITILPNQVPKNDRLIVGGREYVSLEDVLKIMEFIISNDKTPRYPYSDGKTEKRKNARGQLPDSGRWLTPSEIAENFVRANPPIKE